MERLCHLSIVMKTFHDSNGKWSDWFFSSSSFFYSLYMVFHIEMKLSVFFLMLLPTSMFIILSSALVVCLVILYQLVIYLLLPLPSKCRPFCWWVYSRIFCFIWPICASWILLIVLGYRFLNLLFMDYFSFWF